MVLVEHLQKTKKESKNLKKQGILDKIPQVEQSKMKIFLIKNNNKN